MQKRSKVALTESTGTSALDKAEKRRDHAEFLASLPQHVFTAGMLADVYVTPTKAYDVDIERNGKYGNYPASIGEIMMSRYVLLEQLSSGNFSTIWLAQDTKKQNTVVMKIKKNNKNYLEKAFYEIEVLQKTMLQNKSPAWAADLAKLRTKPLAKPKKPKNHVIKMLNSFIYESQFEIRFCIVFELLDVSLRTVIERYENKGVPLKLAREIVKQTLTALHFLHHHCQLIHNSIQPENIMFAFSKKSRNEIEKRGSVSITGEAQSRLSVAKRIVKEINNQTDINSCGMLTQSVLMGITALYPWSINVNIANPSTNRPDASFESAEVLAESLSQGDNDQLDENDYERVGDEEQLRKLEEDHFQAEFERYVKENNLKTKKELKNAKRKLKKKQKKRNIRGNLLSREEFGLRNLSEASRVRRYVPRIVKNRKLDTATSGLPAKFNAKLIDFANTCSANQHFQNKDQELCYQSPEAVLGIVQSVSSDIWSLGCTVFELLTGEKLFQPRANKNIKDKEELIAQMTELLGHFPSVFALSGSRSKKYFNAQGLLKKDLKLSFLGLKDTLLKVYRVKESEVELFADFLQRMLEPVPAKRWTAWQLLHHRWLHESTDDFFASNEEIAANPKLYAIPETGIVPAVKSLANEDAFDADCSYSSSEIEDVQEDADEYFDSEESELKFVDRSFRVNWLYSDNIDSYKMDNTISWKEDNK